MYKQRNNFSILNIPSADKKKLEAKEILSSLMNEALGINDLNSLYQNKEVKPGQEQQPIAAATIPNTDEMKFATLAAPQQDEALLKKTYDNTLLLGISKPFKIVFTDLQSNEVTQPEDALKEEIQILDDEVLVPMAARENEIKKENTAASKKKDEKTDEKDEKKDEEEGDVDYDFLVVLPASEVLSKELIDTINKAGQGMISNPVIKKMDEVPLGSVKPVGRIQSVEDDIEGYSVAGMDNPIAMKLMK